MKAVDQLYVQDADLPVGDCLRACVASMFELERADVPHFMERAYLSGMKTSWFRQLQLWAWDYGLTLNFIEYGRLQKSVRRWHPGYWIAAVQSAGCYRGNEAGENAKVGTHAVVMQGKEVAHDPNVRSRDWHKETGAPYLFSAEFWFELANPAAFASALAAK